MKLRTISLMIIAVLMVGGAAWAQDNVRGRSEPIVNSIDVSKLTCDYLVDGNLAQDDPANKQFKTVQAAYAAAPQGTEARPTVIGIKPNVYAITGSLERAPSLSITKNWITFLGLTNNRRAVVLADNRGLAEGANDDGYLLDVNATGFCMKNLTVINYCNCDYEYPGDPGKNLKMRNPTITQAVALQTSGDKHVFENVALLSRLDTCFIRTNRSYFNNVYIEGTDDWMGGGQTSVWEDSTLVYPTGRGVMSASGCIFFNCTFEATRGMQFYKAEYGGAARPDALIDCTFPVSSPQSPISWVRAKAAPRPSQYSLTYHNKDTAGNPIALADDNVSSPPTYTYSRELSEEELKAYNLWNLLRGDDDWNPAGVRTKYEAHGKLVYRMSVSMGGSGGRGGRRGGPAGGAALIGAPGAGATSTSGSIRTGGSGITIGATVTPSDAADTTIAWSTPSKLISLSATTGPEVVVTPQNTTDQAEYVPVQAKASNGFYVTAYVYVEPKFIDPPAVTSAPKINAPTGGKVSVDYTLALAGKQDRSLITWYTCDDASGTNPVIVAVSRGDQPLKTYTLMPADAGKFPRVTIEPKHNISEAGRVVFAVASSPIMASDIPSPNVDPNFRNFVETPTTPAPGRWTVLGSWSIVPGDNYVNGYGIRGGAAAGRGGRGPAVPTPNAAAAGPMVGAAGPGSSLFYFKSGDTGDMHVDLVMTPDKTEGTVFAVPGSPDDTAGGRNSHGDIYIKYDPITRNGYALRYWRTIESAAACKYQFYKIENGVASPLNDKQILSGVFKQNTMLTLKVTGSIISVSARNAVDNQVLNMEGTIVPNHFGAAGVWSTGATTTYSQIKVSYP